MAERVEKVKKNTGIYQRHRSSSTSPTGKCKCPYQATVYSARERKLIRCQFDLLQAAKDWRSEAATGVKEGAVRASKRTTVDEAAAALVSGMRDGSIRTTLACCTSHR